MPYGLRIKDALGAVQVEYTSTLPRILGQFDTGVADGSISTPGLAGGTPFFLILSSPGVASFLNLPVIVPGASSFSWYFVSPQERVSARVAYGRIG
ncbi:hypothetical protein [Achromobacter sp. SLBN-14]|uniref:hypothetical protein n=1 Tax=Achromobacter sp. SLBN-14 TaxID=2768442 RepID=UPI0011533215|nr:hypothetical protein [Achromobacter sp. SLBN-14]TQJ97332.1 hypothetical protein FBY20_4127 [Achromobacter sp. SLBN-14]